ncbi:MAG TPA: tripartite tricarboxylate transporter TctB family protein [Candidatus Sulfotelmatobacter sp.]|nr:tripartite tricarboxylate transporter TctB family protein [Candidatus Sulfotelmatobacter sp.]
MNSQSIFAGLFLAAGILYEIVALEMPRGRVGYPGPGFYPVIVGAFLVLTAAACLIQALTAKPAGTPAEAAGEGEGRRQIGRTWVLLAALVAYILVLQPVGFPIAMTAFLAVSIGAFGYRRWLPLLLMAVAMTAVSYVCFVMWLKVPLPLGILTDLLD